MKALILFVCWCGLWILSPVVAVLAALLLPVVWLLSIPFRLLAALVNGVLALVSAILLLPARLLGYRGHPG